MSGGVAWIPNNYLMPDVGASDSRERAPEYLESLSLEKTQRSLLETYVDAGPDVLRFTAEQTQLQFHALRFPDYHAEFPGSSFGRSVMPGVFDARMLGEVRSGLRMSPHFPVPISLLDMERAGADGVLGDMNAILSSETLMTRVQNDMFASGTALGAGLLKAAIDKGIELRRGVRASSLLIEGGSVAGIAVEEGAGTTRIDAQRGVILASGGFERNAQLVNDFIRGSLEAPTGAPSNQGDGLLMAMKAAQHLVI